MGVSSGNKINNLLKTGISGGLFFSEWLSANGYAPQLVRKYCTNGWIEALCKGVFCRTGDLLTAYAAMASYRKQMGLDIRVAAYSALELRGVIHFVPMGKPQMVVASDVRKKMNWLSLDKFDRIFVQLCSSQLARMAPETVIHEGLELTISSAEQAILECLFLAPKRYSYMDVYYLIEQLPTLRADVMQKLLECTKSFRVKRMFLYMAEKVNYPWVAELEMNKIDLGKSSLQLCSGGSYVSKYKMIIPKELVDYK